VITIGNYIQLFVRNISVQVDSATKYVYIVY